MSPIKTTKNERSVLQWLLPRVSATGVIRVSNYEVSLNMGWSQQYTQRVLRKLEAKGLLEELQKGTGHRASKYRIFVELSLRGVASFSHTQKGASHNQLWIIGHRAYQYVPSHNSLVVTDNHQKEESARSLLFIQNESPLISPTITGNDTAYSVFGNAKRVRTPVKTQNTPFKRFRVKSDDPKSWGPTDSVCYYSYLYHNRYGETPTLNWPKECGAARTLIQRLGESGAIKTFLQVAFYKYKGKPRSLASFSYADFYETCIDADNIADAVDEYDDEDVFPWLREARRKESEEYYADYYQKLAQPWSLERQKREEAERRRKSRARMDRHMAENWHLYSEIGR